MALSTALQRNIPVHVSAGAVAEVILHQVPAVAGVGPIVLAVAALLLGLVEGQIGVLGVDGGDGAFYQPIGRSPL